MTESKNNGQRLRELRKETGHSVEWCSRHIGRVKDRTWRYWESGNRTVPDDVISAMQRLSDAVKSVTTAEQAA